MISSRQKKIREALPDALDLLVVCVEAGQGLDAAIKRVAEDLQESSPIISQELLLVNLEIMAGLERQQALKNLGERTGVEELVSLCNILIQSDRFGTSIAQALKTQSDYIRTARRQRLEGLAAKTPVKLLFPMLLFIFPAIMVVILGPAIITLIRILQQGRVNRAARRPDGGGFRWDPDRPPPVFTLHLQLIPGIGHRRGGFLQHRLFFLAQFQGQDFFDPPGSQDHRHPEVKILQAVLSIQIG